MNLVSKTPLVSGEFIKETYCIDKTLLKPLSFSGQWTFYMTFPKNDSCDVIGHYVMVKPDISHERSRSKLYVREVSW